MAKPRLNIITPVTRPENLPRILESLTGANEQPGLDVLWIVVFAENDIDYGGEAVRNRLTGSSPKVPHGNNATDRGPAVDWLRRSRPD